MSLVDILTMKLFCYKFDNDDIWCRAIRGILYFAGLDHVFHSKTTCDITEYKSKLMEKYDAEWVALSMSKPKLSTYVQ